MAIALPSKKIKALIIVVCALFISYFLSTLDIASWFQSVKKVVYDPTLEASSNDVDTSLDTDNDGLKDWQETLWGSDIDNPDTDGDGVKDAEEIENGRDPKIAGPNDKLEDTRGISASSVEVFSKGISDDPNNLSTSLSKDFFARFMSLQTTGKLDTVSQEELVNQVLNNIDPGSIPPRYTTADITIVDTNATNLKKYGNQMASVLNTFQNQNTGNIPNQEALVSYRAFIEDLKKIPVTGNLGTNHLKIINNLNASAESINMILTAEKDPAKALLAMRTIQTSAQETSLLFQNIATTFKSNGIIFNQGEPGITWNTY